MYIIQHLMPNEPHLKLLEIILPPGGEWIADSRCWVTLRVAEGVGYCRFNGLARELTASDMIIAAPNSGAVVRASQLGMLRFEFFRVIPQRLNGLITVMEWRELEQISTLPAPPVIRYAVDEAPAQKLSRLVGLQERDSLAARAALLQLWAACVATLLPSLSNSLAGKHNLEASFQRFFSTISEKELVTSSLAEMAVQLNCSQRHLSRLFRAKFGVSLREKQTQLSLQHACELLLDPKVKVRTVAYETGYRHIGFFNALFKKRFGLTPKQWRQQNLAGSESQNTDRLPSVQEQCSGSVATRNVNALMSSRGAFGNEAAEMNWHRGHSDADTNGSSARKPEGNSCEWRTATKVRPKNRAAKDKS